MGKTLWMHSGIMALVVLTMLGCSGGGGTSGPVTPQPPSSISVSIQPSATQVTAGSNQTFVAAVTGTTDTRVDLSVQEGNSGGSITGTGVYTAPFVSGVFHVVARSRADSTKSAVAVVTVPAADPSISKIHPLAALMGSDSVVISVTGSNIFPNSVVMFNGMSLATNYISSTELQAAIPAAQLANSGFDQITVANPALGGGVSTALDFIVVDPAQVSIAVSPGNASITAATSKKFVATLTGLPDTGVTWSVNGTPGGNNSIGTISNVGIYTAPSAATAQQVSLNATSTFVPAKSASVAVNIVPVIESQKQMITAASGGTIQLPSGSSVTIPPGVLTQDCNAVFQSTSAPVQPLNDSFAGIGRSLLFSCLQPSTATRQAPSNELASLTSSGTVTFVIQEDPNLVAPSQNAVGFVNAHDITDTYFSAPLSYDFSLNQATLQVDAAFIGDANSVQVGVSDIQSSAFSGSASGISNPAVMPAPRLVSDLSIASSSGTAVLERWTKASGFISTDSTFCPSGRTLLFIHGIFSKPERFAELGAPKSFHESNPAAPYTTIVAIRYDWTQLIVPDLSTAVAEIVNTIFDGTCSSSPEFDIEANSQGTVVTLASLSHFSPTSLGKLRRLILVAGPLEGTPMARDFGGFASYLGNQTPDIPFIRNDAGAYDYLAQLSENSPTIQDANEVAVSKAKNVELIALGGNRSDFNDLLNAIAGKTISPRLDNLANEYLQKIFGDQPNDAIVPLSSALPEDSALPNLVLLPPYPVGHFKILNDPTVVNDVLANVTGGGATAQIMLDISPNPPPSLNAGNSLPLAADVRGMLNPVITWIADAGTFDTNSGSTVTYTAPLTPGTFHVTARMAALPNLSATATIVVGGSSTSGPTISNFTTSTTPLADHPFNGTIKGTGFSPDTQVFFCVNFSGTCFQHPPAGVTVNDTTNVSVTSVQLSSGSWQVYVRTSAGQSGRSGTFQVQPAGTVPTVSGFVWNSTPAANQPFSGTIVGSGFDADAQVFFCMNGSRTCFQHPPAGVTVNDSSSISVVNVQLSSGMWQLYIKTSGGQSSRSSSFTVQSATAPTVTGYTWTPATPVAGQNFSGNVSGTGFVAGSTQVWFCVNATSICYEHPAAGITVNSSTSLSLANVNLSSGSWQFYVVTSAGQSARSTSFTVQPGTVPTITGYSLTPAMPVAGQNFSGSVNGTGFVAGSTEVWFCLAGTTTCFQHPAAGVAVSSSTNLSLTNVNLGISGSWQFYVVTVAGQSARSTSFTVQAVPAPSISSMSPNPVPGSSVDQAVFINGANFVSGTGLKVRVSNGSFTTDLTGTQVTWISGAQIKILITVGTSAANWTAQVFNPDGQGSNIFSFSVTAANPAPSISSMSPNPVPGSSVDQAVFINGANFVSGTGLKVRVSNGSFTTDLTGTQVTWLSGSQIKILITVGTSAANWTAQVFNPDGQGSNVFTFSVT